MFCAENTVCRTSQEVHFLGFGSGVVRCGFLRKGNPQYFLLKISSKKTVLFIYCKTL